MPHIKPLQNILAKYIELYVEQSSFHRNWSTTDHIFRQAITIL